MPKIGEGSEPNSSFNSELPMWKLSQGKESVRSILQDSHKTQFREAGAIFRHSHAGLQYKFEAAGRLSSRDICPAQGSQCFAYVTCYAKGFPPESNLV